jgi:hypothetical protein
MQIITELRIVQWQNIIYIAEAGYYSIFILEKPLKEVCLISM